MQTSFSASSITISCPPSTCVKNNCRCTISGTTSGYVYSYSTADCSGMPIEQKELSGSTYNWQPIDTGIYYLKVVYGSQVSDCTQVTVFEAVSTTTITGSTTTTLTTRTPSGTTTPTTVTTTTTVIEGGCSYDNPCQADCGKRKINRITYDQDYYEFFLDSASNVTVKLEPSNNVDYDLYVNWDGKKPETDKYDCKPVGGMGEKRECKKSGLFEGYYYVMVAHYEGSGVYNLSISCTSIGSGTVSCSDPDHPCKIDCGKSKIGRSTNGKDYFTFNLNYKSNVTVKISLTSSVDYDLYFNGGDIPTMDKYDCKSSSGKGEREECIMPNLNTGSYYVMVDYYEGIGTYDLSLSCLTIKTTTTTTVSATTAIATTTPSGALTTTKPTTTTTVKISNCGSNGYCENENKECKSGYEDCTDYNEDCTGTDEKCCCVAVIHPEPNNLGLIVGLVVFLLIVILIYFFMKNRSGITFDKLYRKWSRLLIETPQI